MNQTITLPYDRRPMVDVAAPTSSGDGFLGQKGLPVADGPRKKQLDALWHRERERENGEDDKRVSYAGPTGVAETGASSMHSVHEKTMIVRNETIQTWIVWRVLAYGIFSSGTSFDSCSVVDLSTLPELLLKLSLAGACSSVWHETRADS